MYGSPSNSSIVALLFHPSSRSWSLRSICVIASFNMNNLEILTPGFGVIPHANSHTLRTFTRCDLLNNAILATQSSTVDIDICNQIRQFVTIVNISGTTGSSYKHRVALMPLNSVKFWARGDFRTPHCHCHPSVAQCTGEQWKCILAAIQIDPVLTLRRCRHWIRPHMLKISIEHGFHAST